MKKLAFGFGTAIMLCALNGFAAQPENEQIPAKPNEPRQQQPSEQTLESPYASHSAGIELCPGMRSGASLEWFFKDVKSRGANFQVRGASSTEWWVSLLRSDMSGCIFVFATEEQPDRNMAAALGKKEIRGSLFKVSTVELDKVDKVIAKYRKLFPDLKHTRTNKNDLHQTQREGIVIKVKKITVTDKLSSDKVDISIISSNVEVAASGNQPRETLKQIADFVRMDLMRDIRRQGIQVIITDKVLEKHFAALRNGSTPR